MNSIAVAILGLFALIAALVVAAVVIVPLAGGVVWLLAHVGRFIAGMFVDSLRLVGSLLLSLLYVPLNLGAVVIGRWEAARHFWRASEEELYRAIACLYRLCIGHPARLLFLGGLTEGFERRFPEVVAAAPGPDVPATPASSRRASFEGYEIVGTLTPGGSGARLYIAEPDANKDRSLRDAGFAGGKVVIKSFSLSEGSTLPQIVRESRSLDAARRMGLILDHELTHERFFYVMPYVPGESLAQVTKRLHSAGPGEGLGSEQLAAVVGYAIDVVEALGAYHRGGLWHKDVKPDNIIVATGGDGRAHLVDFGLVSSLRSSMTLTTHGTEYFRDPELVRRALQGVKVHEVDGSRFDLYAAGAVLYSMVEGSFPAHGGLSQVSRRCPEALKWIVRRAMTDYDRRYATADELLADLRHVRAAADPFAVLPFHLPSVKGAAPVDVAAAVADSPTSQPIPGPSPANAVAASARAPGRIRVVNWWSGRMEVDSSDPASPPPVRTTIGGGRSLVDRANRRPAAEQLASARARVEAARTRMPRGGNNARGVDLALAGGVLACLVAGAALGLGMVEFGSSAHAPAARVVVWDNAAALVRLAGVAPSAHLVVINDLKEPLPPHVREWVVTLERALAAAGCTMAGEAATEGDPSEDSMAKAAALRLSIAAATPGEPEGANRLAAWLKDHPEVGAVVWVAPTIGDPDGTPTVTLARGGMDDSLWDRVSQLVQEQAGGPIAE
jgi:serine/threonine protein kinase